MDVLCILHSIRKWGFMAFAYRKYMTIISFESVCIVWATLWRRRQWAMMVVVAKKENGQFPCTSLSDDRPILLMLLSLLLATYSLPITSIFQLIVSTFDIATSVRVRVWCDAGAALAKCLYTIYRYTSLVCLYLFRIVACRGSTRKLIGKYNHARKHTHTHS